MVNKRCATGAAAMGLAIVVGGCAAARRPRVVVRPSYSYYRDGGPLARAGSGTISGGAAKRTARTRSLARQLAAMRQVAATGATYPTPASRANDTTPLVEASRVR